jgi:regulator of replication initiation timing
MAESRKNNSTIYLVIIAILVVVIGYLIFNQNKQSETIEQQTETIETQDAEITEKAKELDGLRLEYARVLEERTQLGLNNDTLNAQIASLDMTIRQLKRSGKLNAEKRAELEKLVQELKADIEARDQEIAQLRQQVDSLGKENTTLQSEKQEMGSQIENLKSTEKQLSEKVAIASRMKAENVALSVLNEKGKEREGNEHKAKNIDKVKLVFNLAKNDVAEKNAKEILLKVTDPSGTVLYDLSVGGGIFTFNGEKSFYTAKQDVAFDNSGQKVEFIYSKGMPFIKGNHTFELFCEGHKIGDAALLVK